MEGDGNDYVIFQGRDTKQKNGDHLKLPYFISEEEC